MKKFLILAALLLTSIVSLTACVDEKEEDPFMYDRSGKAQIFWRSDSSADSYLVAITKGPLKDESFIKVDASKNTYTFENLFDDSLYFYYVYSVAENGSKKQIAKGNVISSASDPCLRVMAYFLDSASTLEEQSLHLAYTTDGLTWNALNNNEAVFKLSTLGGNKIRDPYIVKKADGSYLMIATDWTLHQSDGSMGNHRLYDGSTSEETNWGYVTNNYWDVNTTCLIFADSDDMITWTNERQIQMVSDEAKKGFKKAFGNYQFCWAPEIIQNNGKTIHVDAAGKEYKYGVIWSGSGETNGTESKLWNSEEKSYVVTKGHNFNYRRTFVNWTNDFETFTEAEVYFNPGNSNIDASVISDEKGNYYLFYKDEFNNRDGSVQANKAVRPNGQYSLSYSMATSLESGAFDSNPVYNWNVNGKQITSVANSPVYYSQGEGMFCFKPFADKDLWYVALDAHDAGKSKIFAMYKTTDFKTWTQDDRTTWPSGAIRHGCSVPATTNEISDLIDAFAK